MRRMRQAIWQQVYPPHKPSIILCKSKFYANPAGTEKRVDGRLQQSIEALIHTENLS